MKLHDYDGTEVTYKEFFISRTKLYFEPLTTLYKKYTKAFKIAIGALGLMGLFMSLEPGLFIFGQILYGFAVIHLIILPYFIEERKKKKLKENDESVN